MILAKTTCQLILSTNFEIPSETKSNLGYLKIRTNHLAEIAYTETNKQKWNTRRRKSKKYNIDFRPTKIVFFLRNRSSRKTTMSLSCFKKGSIGLPREKKIRNTVIGVYFRFFYFFLVPVYLIGSNLYLIRVRQIVVMATRPLGRGGFLFFFGRPLVSDHFMGRGRVVNNSWRAGGNDGNRLG